ncbi:MAG: superoxide dismutase [Saprospiraceae bacterium]
MLQKTFFIFIITCTGFIATAQDDKFTLPELNYAYDALEPHIDAKTMEVHYTKHHQGYLNNLNKSGATTITGVNASTIEDLLLSVDGKNASLRNNGGGYYNHNLFWSILSPTPQKIATGNLAMAIKNQFGSQDSLMKLMNSEGLKRFGSGWVWLVVTPFKSLAITSSSNQDNPIMDLDEMKRGIPILGIDVWEHAYYLKYQNKRGDYLSSIWNVVDWAAVEKHYESALKDPLLKKIDKSSWSAYKEFNNLYNQMTLPAKSGDFTLLKLKSGELLEKAEKLAKSNVPASFQNMDIKKVLNNIVSSVKSVQKSVTKKPKTEVIQSKLNELQEAYSELQNILTKQ